MYGFTSISKGDLEEGTPYPGSQYEEKKLRWRFISTAYEILAAQIVLTKIFYSATVLYSPINQFLWTSPRLVFFFIVLSGIPIYWPLYIFHHKHPLNFIFLGLFTVSLSIIVEAECASTEGKVVIEALILSSILVSALTWYTFWASRKGKDFSYLVPILLWSLVVLVFSFILSLFMPLIFSPLGPTSIILYGAVGAMVFSGFLVYYTDSMINRFSNDHYIWASALLYGEIIYLFLSILRMLRAMQSDVHVLESMNQDIFRFLNPWL